MTDYAWDAPPAEAVDRARRAASAILDAPDTVAKLTTYYDPDGGYAADTFHTLEPVDPQQITASDLLAVTLMDVAVRPAALRRLLLPGPARQQVTSALREVPSGGELAAADAATLDAAAGLYRAIKSTLAGNKWVTASKVAARKRPGLIPVRDRVVVEELHLDNRDFREDWAVLRSVMRDDHVALSLRDLAARVSQQGPDVSEVPQLRLLDTAVWMHRRSPAAEEEASDAGE